MPIGVNHKRIDVDLDDVRPGAHQAPERCGYRRDRLDIGRRRAAESMQQFRGLELASSSTISSSVRSGAISRTSPRASTQMPPETDHQNRAPSRIAARADDEFKPARRHGFDQNAIQLQARLRALHAGVQRRPGFAYRLSVGHAKSDTAGLGLVSELRGLRFHRDRIADAISDGLAASALRASSPAGVRTPSAASTFLPSHSGCGPGPSSGN